MRGSWPLMLLLLFAHTAHAEERELPSMELLEFLGEWQDENGNAIDPGELAQLQIDSAAAGGKSDDKE